MTCLFLAIGATISSGEAQASQGSHPRFGSTPHITVKILSNTTHLYNNKYLADAVIYGIGFNDCTCNCNTDCGNSGNVPPNYNNTPDTTSCNYHNSCGNSGNVPPNYNNTPDTSNSTCPSYNNCAPSDGCNCNTVNLQSNNADLSAPGVNLSEVPVNTFGEFKVTVHVQVTPKQTQTAPSIWAVNRDNGQSSNSAPVSCCSSSSCCW